MPRSNSLAVFRFSYFSRLPPRPFTCSLPSWTIKQRNVMRKCLRKLNRPALKILLHFHSSAFLFGSDVCPCSVVCRYAILTMANDWFVGSQSQNEARTKRGNLHLSECLISRRFSRNISTKTTKFFCSPFRPTTSVASMRSTTETKPEECTKSLH